MGKKKDKASPITEYRYKQFEIIGNTTVNRNVAILAQREGRQYVIRTPAVRWQGPVKTVDKMEAMAYLEAVAGQLFYLSMGVRFSPSFFIVRNGIHTLVGWEQPPAELKEWLPKNNGNPGFLQVPGKGLADILFLSLLTGDWNIIPPNLLYSLQGKAYHFHKVDHRGAFQRCLPEHCTFEHLIRDCITLASPALHDSVKGTQYRLFKHLFSKERLVQAIHRLDEEVIKDLVTCHPCLKEFHLEKKVLSPFLSILEDLEDD